jgi:hypothetical protein
MAVIEAALAFRGVLRLDVFDALTGALVDSRESGNLIVTSGLTAIASAMNWAFIQNYNAGWGSPFSSSSGNLGDVYGAVGTGTTTPAAGDTALGTEIGRVILTSGTDSANVLTYQFFFGTNSGNGTVQEAGLFVNAATQQVTLSAGLTQNQVYTSLSTTATTATIPTGSTLIINYGGAQVSGALQQVITSGPTSSGSTTINVNSFTSSQTFPIGTVVAYNTGTLLNHALISPAISKTSAQTATLNFSMTLQSA